MIYRASFGENSKQNPTTFFHSRFPNIVTEEKIHSERLSQSIPIGKFSKLRFQKRKKKSKTKKVIENEREPVTDISKRRRRRKVPLRFSFAGDNHRIIHSRRQKKSDSEETLIQRKSIVPKSRTESARREKGRRVSFFEIRFCKGQGESSGEVGDDWRGGPARLRLRLIRNSGKRFLLYSSWPGWTLLN